MDGKCPSLLDTLGFLKFPEEINPSQQMEIPQQIKDIDHLLSSEITDSEAMLESQLTKSELANQQSELINKPTELTNQQSEIIQDELSTKEDFQPYEIQEKESSISETEQFGRGRPLIRKYGRKGKGNHSQYKKRLVRKSLSKKHSVKKILKKNSNKKSKKRTLRMVKKISKKPSTKKIIKKNTKNTSKKLSKRTSSKKIKLVTKN